MSLSVEIFRLASANCSTQSKLFTDLNDNPSIVSVRFIPIDIIQAEDSPTIKLFEQDEAQKLSHNKELWPQMLYAAVVLSVGLFHFKIPDDRSDRIEDLTKIRIDGSDGAHSI